MIILDLEQNSQEWHEARRGMITGTKLKDVMGTSLKQLDLVSELIAEEGTEKTKDFNPTAVMERGSAEEQFAIKLFEKERDLKIDTLGFCISEDPELKDFVAMSPDGGIKDTEGKYSAQVEVKSPNSQTVIKYKISNMIDTKETGLTPAKAPFLGIPADYKWQIVMNFIVNEDLRKMYFVIYDERFIDPKQKLYVVEINWENEVLQKAIYEAKEELKEFRAKWLKWKEVVLPVTNF